MPAVEVWSERGRDRIVTLAVPTYTIGSDPESDISLDDRTVSSVHAVLERVGTTWLVRDLGSRNGTLLMGERLTGQRRLRHGDEIQVGHVRLVFLDSAEAARPRTEAIQGPPEHITRTEKRVLVELCRPVLSHNAFQPPASVREIAARLYIGKNAVQFHLGNLYDKFGIAADGTDRRVFLANDAMRRGAVTRTDLLSQDESGDEEHEGA
jgi:hypothetical protein